MHVKLAKLVKILMVDNAGDPSALESQIRQLDKALDDSRFQMQQTENIIRSKTPTGPELDSSYRGYVSILTSGIRTSTWKSVCDKEQHVWGSPNTMLELTSVQVQKKALLARYLLSQSALCSGPITYCNNQPVPLNRELSEISLIESNKMLQLLQMIRHFPQIQLRILRPQLSSGQQILATRLLTRNFFSSFPGFIDSLNGLGNIFIMLLLEKIIPARGMFGKDGERLCILPLLFLKLFVTYIMTYLLCSSYRPHNFPQRTTYFPTHT